MRHLVVFFAAFFVLVCPCGDHGLRQARGQDSQRWNGHDFVFCFTTDDGVEGTAAQMDSLFAELGLQYTAFVNPMHAQMYSPFYRAAPEVLLEYWQRGNTEIGHHGYSHASQWDDPRYENQGGLISAADTCAINWSEYSGSYCGNLLEGNLLGYFQPGCWREFGWGRDTSENLIYRTSLTTAQHFAAEVERDSIETIIGVPRAEVRTLAYPKHGYNSTIVALLHAVGYLGARSAPSCQDSHWGDITTAPYNEWARISVYRVPTMLRLRDFFADEYTRGEGEAAFKEAFGPHLSEYRASGGMAVIMTHTTNPVDGGYYGDQYLLPEEIHWMIDAVADSGGITMSFGDAMAYYRDAASSMLVTDSGDLVFEVATQTGVVPEGPPSPIVTASAWPNPFNPLVTIEFALGRETPTRIRVYDAAGRVVDTILDNRELPAGQHQAVWDGKTAAGVAAASGAYFCEILTPSASTVLNIILAK